MAQLVSIVVIAQNGVGLNVATTMAFPVQSIALETVNNTYKLGLGRTKITYSTPNLKAPIIYESNTIIATIVTAANAV